MRSIIETASRQVRTLASDRARGSSFVTSAEESGTGAAKSAAVSSRRTGIFSSILLDAARGAREYVERWVAGRGAE